MLIFLRKKIMLEQAYFRVHTPTFIIEPHKLQKPILKTLLFIFYSCKKIDRY